MAAISCHSYNDFGKPYFVNDKKDSKMFKISVTITLMFVVSAAWAAGLFCDSCGGECAPACGTRRFRACCFNYLRRKRGPDDVKINTFAQDVKESQSGSKLPVIIVEDISMPEKWIANMLSNENHPFHPDDTVENRLD